MRKLSLFLIIYLSIMMLTSCYDSNEMDDLLHIVSIGVDKGVTDKWRLTVMFPTLKGDSGGGTQKGGGGQEEYSALTIDAPSIFTGIDMLNSTLARRLNFMHTELMVISEDLAKSGMLGEFLASMIRFRQIRRTMHIFISKGPAMDYIEATKPLIGTALSKNIQIMDEEAGITGFFSSSTLQNLYTRMKSSYQQPVVPYGALNNPKNLKQDEENSENEFKTGGEYYAGELPLNAPSGTQLFGVALFDGDKMIGKLTGDETRLMQIANGEFKMGFFTMQDPKEPSLVIPLDVRKQGKSSVKIKFEEDKPIIHLKIELEGDLLAVQSRIDYEKLELKPILEKAFEKQIKDGLDKLIKKVKGLKTDIFGFGETAAMHFLTIQEWEKYNWNNKFQNAKITTEVKFTIRRTGAQLRSSPIITTEGKE